MKTLQTLEQNEDIYFTQRVSIFHNGDTLIGYSGRVLRIDGRLLYRQMRFSKKGEDKMIEFANRCGFEDINSFFKHYEKFTDGEPFYGIIKFTDGFRWFQLEDLKSE